METTLLLVDVQPAFLDTMHGDPEPLLVRLEQLLILAHAVRMQVVATVERPVEKKGDIPDRIADLLVKGGAGRYSKWHFDAMAEEEGIRHVVASTGCTRVAVAGAETDVCILQSVLGLLREGYEVILLEDCLFSSEADPEPAIARMRQAGARPCTYKSFFYEVIGKASDPGQPGASRTAGLRAPEELPPRSA